MGSLDILITIHALSIWNELRQRQGHCNPGLSQTGQKMASLLATRLDLQQVKRIYTSDLKRAHHTAQPLSQKIGIPITTMSHLREGNWANHHVDPDYPPLPFDSPYEDREALTQRAIQTLTHIAQTEIKQAQLNRVELCSPILIITHGGFLKNFIAKTFPDRAPEYRGIRTALNHLNYSDHRWRVLKLNDDMHLSDLVPGE